MSAPTENERLRALLREAGAWMLADAKMNKGYAEKVLELHGRITATLAVESLVGHQVCEFCKGTGTVPMKTPWSPQDVLGGNDAE